MGLLMMIMIIITNVVIVIITNMMIIIITNLLSRPLSCNSLWLPRGPLGFSG